MSGSQLVKQSPVGANVRGVNQESSEKDQDWVSQAIGTLEGFVDTIRSKTSEPLLKVVQAIVYGMMALGLLLTALLLFTIGSVRALDAYLPQGVWFAYFLTGLLLFVGGAALWRMRHKTQKPN